MECSDGWALVEGYNGRRTELWDRWQRGESLRRRSVGIGEPSSFDYPPGATARWDSSSSRRRSQFGADALGTRGSERGVADHRSARSMAGLLGRSPSTVSREISGTEAMMATKQRWLAKMLETSPPPETL